MSAPLAEILAPFPAERTWLLPALQAVQADRGWLAEDDLAAVSAHLHVPASEVYGVATHYPELRLARPGEHVVRVCAGVSCRINGGRALLAALEGRLGVAAGETTADGRVTLEEADCCFVCGVAPVVEVDHRYLGGPTVEAVLEACAGAHGAAGRVRAGGAADSRAAPGPARLEPAAPATPAAPPGGAPPGGRPGAAGALARLVGGLGAAPPLRLLVEAGSCGLARGAGTLLRVLPDALARAGIAATVEAGACSGLCHAAPVVDVLRAGAGRLTVERVLPGQVPALMRLLRGAADHGLDGAAWPGPADGDGPAPGRGQPGPAPEAAGRGAGAGLVPAARHPVLGDQQRVLGERWGAIAPESLEDALRAGSYAALAGTLDAGDPLAVIAAVKAAGLQGRGGAYFPAAVKWEGCRAAGGRPRYLVANGEEGEPGIFKDRHLMEADPHRLLEGMLLAAYAAGASRGILYVHGEADLSAERCRAAVGQAYAAGLLGPHVLGSDFAFDVEIRRGAGGFILGEETALLESIEGRRAMPRPKPPFPVEAGVHGKPTVVNNVETLSAVPLIVAGRAEAARTKLFGLSGHVRRPGIVEVAPPVTLRRLIEGPGGGLRDGATLQAVVIGGPSGVIVPGAALDAPLERPALSPGTGGLVVLDGSASIPDVVRTLLAFNARESCGKCTPCREGTARMLAVLDRLAGGDDRPAGGARPADPDRRDPGAAGGAGRAADVALLRELADVVQLASLCGLGQAAPLALRSALEHFPGAFGLGPGGAGGGGPE